MQQLRIANKNMDLEDVVEEKLSYIKDLEELPEDWEFENGTDISNQT